MPFKPGNKDAVGNKGASRPNFLTQALISQLNECNTRTNTKKLHMLAERLIALALGGEFVVDIVDRDGRRLNDDNVGREASQIEIDLYDVGRKKMVPRIGDPVRTKTPDGARFITRYVPPDIAAIREVFDRVQGRAVQSVGFDSQTGKVTLTFEKEDESAL